MTSPDEIVGELYRFFAHGRRLALCGPSGVGKTTLAAIIGGLTRAPVHREGAREWLAEHRIRRYWQMSPTAVAEMQLWLLAQLEASEGQVFDRFSVDIMVFAEPAREVLDFPTFEARALRAAQSVDLVIFMPYRSELLKDDGVRKPDPMYQLRTAGKMLDQIQSWSLEKRTMVYEHHRSVLDNLGRGLIQVAPSEAIQLSLDGEQST